MEGRLVEVQAQRLCICDKHCAPQRRSGVLLECSVVDLGRWDAAVVALVSRHLELRRVISGGNFRKWSVREFVAGGSWIELQKACSWYF